MIEGLRAFRSGYEVSYSNGETQQEDEVSDIVRSKTRPSWTGIKSFFHFRDKTLELPLKAPAPRPTFTNIGRRNPTNSETFLLWLSDIRKRAGTRTRK